VFQANRGFIPESSRRMHALQLSEIR